MYLLLISYTSRRYFNWLLAKNFPLRVNGELLGHSTLSLGVVREVLGLDAILEVHVGILQQFVRAGHGLELWTLLRGRLIACVFKLSFGLGY